MSTSSSTTADTRTGTLICPDWCVDAPGHEPFDDFTDTRIHKGPAFGIFRVWGYEEEEAPGQLTLTVSIESPRRDLSVSDMAQVAQDALATAEWLRGQR